jgi:hypothetical protein
MEHLTSARILLVLAALNCAAPARGGCSWNQVARDVGNDVAPLDYYGSALDGDGSRLIVGAVQHFTGGGKAFVFARSPAGWVQEAELVPPPGSNAQDLGGSVSIKGDVAVIGSPYLQAEVSPGQFANTGGAFVFRFCPTTSTWSLEQEPILPSPQEYDFFGASVAVASYPPLTCTASAQRRVTSPPFCVTDRTTPTARC